MTTEEREAWEAKQRAVVPPPALLAEAERQRMEEIVALRRQIESLRSRPLLAEYKGALEFNNTSSVWKKLADIMRRGGTDPASVETMILRPYSSKWCGAWRVEVSFFPFVRGYSGEEWYIDQAEVFAAFAEPDHRADQRDWYEFGHGFAPAS